MTVVSDPADYDEILEEMRANEGCTSLELRRYLQLKVYETTANYDAAIAMWLADRYDEGLRRRGVRGRARAARGARPLSGEGRRPALRRESSAVRRRLSLCDEAADAFSSANPLVGAEQVQGKPLSYNNYLDADAAWNLVREFDGPACVILKHQNPCGSAVAEDITCAYDRAFACDPKSAFGGIIACNREVPFDLVEHAFDENGQFVEVIIAPSYTPEALERMGQAPQPARPWQPAAPRATRAMSCAPWTAACSCRTWTRL